MGEVGVEAGLEPVVGLRIHVHAAGIALEVGVLQHTLFVVVTQRDEIVALGIAAGNGEHMLCAGRAVVGDFLHPVLVPAGHGIRLYKPGVLVDERVPGVVLIGVVVFGVLETADLRAQVGGRIGAGALEVHAGAVLGAVAQGLVHHLDKLIGAQQLVGRESSRSHAEAALIRDVGVILGTLAGGDDDDAVCTAGTVQGTGRCILEHRHALDIGGVDAAEGTVVGNAVHYVQGRIGGADRADTAHGDGGILTGLAATRGDGNARDAAFQAFGHGTHGAFAQVGALHYGRRAGEGLLLGRTVGHHHGVVQFQGLFVQDYVNLAAAVYRHAHALVANAGDLQHGTGRHVLQRIDSVQRSAGTGSCSLHKHARSNNRQAAAVADGTAHGQGTLGQQLHACEQRRQDNCYFLSHLSNSF